MTNSFPSLIQRRIATTIQIIAENTQPPSTILQAKITKDKLTSFCKNLFINTDFSKTSSSDPAPELIDIASFSKVIQLHPTPSSKK
jgi:hypothetical protein